VPLLARFFDTTHDALNAIGDLKSRGLRDAAAQVIDNSSGYVSEHMLLRRGVQKKNAREYAEQVRDGKTLVLVDAPYMGAALATEILERDGGRAFYESGAWEDGAPFSSTFRLPVLHSGSAPLSSFFGMPVLSKRKPSPAYGRPLRKPVRHTAVLGPLLTKSGAPLFGGLLKGGKTTSFGLPLLIKKK